jgi:acetyl-CoA synthetase
MRRLLREIAASGNVVGDVTTLEDFTVIEKLRDDED